MPKCDWLRKEMKLNIFSIVKFTKFSSKKHPRKKPDELLSCPMFMIKKK